VRRALFVALILTGCSDVPSSIPADADPFDSCLGTDTGDPRLGELMSFTRRFLADNDVPGAAIAIARDGEVVAFGVTGSKLAEMCDPITEDTRFLTLIGRHLSAAAVVGAAESGDVSLDDRLVDYLPVFGASGSFDPSAIRIRDLLANTSGYSLSHSSSCLAVDDFFAANDEIPLWAPAGRVHMSLLLDTTLAARSLGTDFVATMRERVLEPLALAGTYDRVEAARGDLATGYTPGDDALRALPFELDTCALPLPYLGLVASIRDAGAFAATLTDPDSALIAGTADSFYPPERATLGGFSRGPLAGEVEWAYAGASSGGYGYDLRIVPGDELAVAVFINAVHADPSAISIEAVRIYTGHTPELDVAPQDAATLPSLAGRYVEPLSGSEMVVTVAGEGLRISLDGRDPADLSPSRRDNSYVDDLLEFAIPIGEDEERIEQLRFWRDAAGDGEVISQDTFRRSLGPPYFRVE
jgi:CubicO group peptidase (beta-lactamase class C family)